MCQASDVHFSNLDPTPGGVRCETFFDMLFISNQILIFVQHATPLTYMTLEIILGETDLLCKLQEPSLVQQLSSQPSMY